jgi:hypothetical protein
MMLLSGGGLELRSIFVSPDVSVVVWVPYVNLLVVFEENVFYMDLLYIYYVYKLIKFKKI